MSEMSKMSFYIDNNNYCIGKLCFHIDKSKNYCEHVVLNKGTLEIWNIFKIRSELGHKIQDFNHFTSNKIKKSVSLSKGIFNSFIQ